MATITYSTDREGEMVGTTDGILETDGSGATMSEGIELNIDKAKVTSKAEIIQALDRMKKAVMESEILVGAV